jgi:hypothetical protein
MSFRINAVAILGTAMLLSACTGPNAPAPATPTAEADACGASTFTTLIGQAVVVTGNLTEIGGTKTAAAGGVRVIGPGDAVTQDLRHDRLNLDVDAAQKLVRPWCG